MIRTFARCPACGHAIRVRTFSPDRVTLARERGERFPLTCPACGTRSEVHVNDVRATPNHFITYIITGVAAVLTVIVLFSVWNIYVLILLGGVLSLPAMVRHAINRAAETFNGYAL